MFKSGAGSVGNSPDLGVSEFKPHVGCRDYLKKKERKQREEGKEGREGKEGKGRERKKGRKEGEMLKSLDKNY